MKTWEALKAAGRGKEDPAEVLDEGCVQHQGGEFMGW